MLFATILALEFFLIYKVWTEEDNTKLFLWFMTAIIMLPPGFKLRPGVPNVNWMFPIVYTVRIVRDKSWKYYWKCYPLRMIYLIVLVFHFVQPIFSKFMSVPMTYFYIVQYVMMTYLYLFIGYCMGPDVKKLSQYKDWIYLLVLILFLIAVYSKMKNFNFITAGLNENSLWSAEKALSERGFRVTATQESPNIFGFINVLLALFIYSIDEKMWKKAALVFMVFVNIVLSATRAPFVGLVAMSALYLFFEDIKKLVRFAMIGGVSVVVLINVFGSNPAVEKYLGGVIDIFTTGGQNTGGSNVEDRGKQMDAAVEIADGSPYWGCGNRYCEEIQNENSIMHVFYKADLLGAEGYLFYTLIDYGYVYTALVGIFFGLLILYILFNLKTDKRVAVMALCATFTLVIHLMTSRPNNSWQVFMPFMGACVYYLQFKKQFTEEENE